MSRELRASMRRHPAGSRHIRHTDATVIPFRQVRSTTTATAETTTEKGNDND